MKTMRQASAMLIGVTLALGMSAQAPAAKTDAFQAIAFLQGTWEAKTEGTNGVQSVGTYSFGPELKSHVWPGARSVSRAAKGRRISIASTATC